MRRTNKPSVAVFAASLSFVALLVNCQFYKSPSPTRHVEAAADFPNYPVVAREDHNRGAASKEATLSGDNSAERIQVAAREAEKLRLEREAADRAQAERQGREKAALERAQFLARYINRKASPKTGSRFALVTSSNQDVGDVLSSAIGQKLTHDALEVDRSFFTPAFISDGLFSTAWDESISLFRKLELEASLDGLILARQRVRFVKSPALENLISATVDLEIKIVPIAPSVGRDLWTFQAVGPGFSEGAAHTAAEERLVKKINAEKSLVLNQATP